MARKEIIIASALTVAGLAGGYLLLPKDSDVAQMEVRDYNYSDPEALFERRFAEGDRSVDVVQQLVRIHTNTGDINRAIEVLEIYVRENPQDSTALKQLGTLYQHGQRYEEYLQILETRAQETEDPVVLTELSQLYNFFQKPEKQKAVLIRLHKAEQGRNPQTIRDLAVFHAVDKEFAAVATLLDGMRADHAGEYSYEDAVAHTHALLRTGQPEAAIDVVSFWHGNARSSAEQVAFLIDMLHYEGAPKYARSMMASIPAEEIQHSPDLLHSQLLLMLADGRQDEAYKLLLSLYEKGELPELLVPDLMYMAAVNGNTARFDELRKKTGLSRLPQGQLADIWTAARRAGQRNVMQSIEQHVAQAGADDYPMLHTMILIGRKSPARHASLRALLETSLDNESLLKLAETSADVGDRSDAQRILAKLPAYDKLSLSELAALETVYLRLGDKETARKFIAYLRDSDRLEEGSPIGLRTAAALGDEATLTAWYNAHGRRADGALLNDLFHHASNAGHLQLALKMAAWQTDPHQQTLARRNIANVYTRLGRYEAALSLLEQDAPRNEADVRDRAFLLSKLAPRGNVYRERLHGLTREWFRPSTSKRTKEDLTYSLMAASGTAAALPYMKSLADQYGGEWTLAYADALVQAGRGDEATPYYLKAAKDPKLDANTRMNIAYALADRGQRAAAEELLVTLAAEPETRMAATRQLTYLWGPRPSEEQLDWLVRNWQRSEGEEQEAYGELLAHKMSPDMLEKHVQRTPELRRIRALDGNYIHMLAEQKRLRPEMETIARYTQESGDTAYLLHLANVARDYGAYPDARYAYDQVLAVSPESQPALVGATVTAAAQADYAAISRYFQRYENVVSVGHETLTPKTHEAYFAYAENLRRQQQPEQARPYYAKAVSLIEENRLYDAESLSIAAQSSAWLGDEEKSGKVFDYAFSRYPDSAILRADRTALFIEQRRYDEAREAWNGILTAPASAANAPKPLTTAMLTSGDTGLTQAPQVLDDGRQLLVHTTPETVAERHWVNNLRLDPSISYVTEGYDSVLIVTKTGYRFEVSQPRGTDWAANTVAAPGMEARSEQAQLALRKELLAARLDLETGRISSAADRMDALEDTYGEDPQYLGFAANTYYYANMWPTAKTLIEDAAARSPDNADIARLNRTIDRNHPDHVRADLTLFNRGKHRELVSSLSGETQATQNWRLGGILRNHDLKTRNELQRDGTLGSRSGNRQSAELYGIYAVNNRSHLTARLFANNDTPGLGLDYRFLNPLGITTIGGRYHEPYFEFIEGIMDDAVRDRIAIDHVYRPRTDWEFSGGLSYNNYSIDGEDDVMDTFGMRLGVTHALRQSQPYIGVGYGLEAEYQIDNTFQQTATGESYRQLPLRSREIHFGSVTVAHDFSEKTYGSVLAGYGWDRLGGNGPAIEGTINHEFYPNWDVGGRAFYGMNTTDTDSSFNIFNGYVRYRF